MIRPQLRLKYITFCDTRKMFFSLGTDLHDYSFAALSATPLYASDLNRLFVDAECIHHTLVERIAH